MKKKMLSGLTVVAAGMIIAGCSDSYNPNSSQNGRIYASFDLDAEVITSAGVSKSPSRQAMAVTASQLAIDLNSEDGRVSRHWDSPDLFPVDEDFPVGAYTMEASYGSPDDQGYDKPYYHGSTTLTVKDSETTPVSITATLANAMVSVSFTDNFKKFFQEYTPSLIAGNANLAYDREEPCYVTPGAVTLQLDVTKFTGAKATLTPKTFTAEPCHHYRLTVDVNAQAGEGQLVLKYDEMLATEDVIIDLSDELINAPAPTLTPKGFNSGDEISFIAGNVPTGEKKITLIAHGGISSVAMTTTSTSLQEQGWPAEADLAAGDAALAARLKALGLSSVGLARNPEKMAVVDITEVASHIEYIDGADNTTTITFTARDNYGKESEPLTVTFAVQKLEMSLSNAGTVFEGEDRATCVLTFNGNEPSGVKIQTRNARGSWENIEAEITPVSRSAAQYNVVAKGLPTTGDVHLRATYGNQASAPIIIERATPAYAVTHRDIDVFATSAKLTLIDNPTYNPASRRSRAAGDVVANSELYISTDGGVTYNKVSGATLSGTTWTVTGLTPNKTYHFRATVNGQPTLATTLATEAATQLTNGDMNSWSEAAGDGKYQKWFYPFAENGTPVWNTYNAVTMSQTGNGGIGYAYKATSGTISTSDSKSGSAAQIRTVGWGSGNTASANIFNRWAFGTCNHVSAGQLFLGNWDNVSPVQNSVPNYGIGFASRPASLSFWYKYAVMNRNGNDNGEKGVVEITLYDAANNVIATKTEKLAPNASYANINSDNDWKVNGTYELKTINLDYTAAAQKAAKISVIFKSSDYTNADLEANKNQDHMRPPKPQNLNYHIYLGASLLVDDITLNY